jgi:hypothetical protein
MLRWVREFARRYRLVATAFLAVLLLGIPTLIVPLYTDQALFALAGRMLLHGEMPYRDFWDIKPPGVYFAYASAFLVMGERMASIRVLDLVNTAAVMVALYLLGKRLFSEPAGILAGCFYGVTYLARSTYQGLGQAESFLALPVVLAVLLYQPAAGRAHFWRPASAGLLMGLAFQIKFSAGLFVLALPLIEALFAGRREGLWPPVRRLTLAAAAFLSVQAVVVTYLVAGGALRDFVDLQRLYVSDYTTLRWSPDGESFVHFMGRTTHEYVTDNLHLVIPAGGAVFLGLFGPKPRETAMVIFLVAAALAGVWAQGKFFSYHWLALLFPLSLLAGYALGELMTLFRRTMQGPRMAAAFGLTGLALVALTPGLVSSPTGEYRNFLGYLCGSVSDAENEGRHSGWYAYEHRLAEYVKADSAPEESFFIWGQWPVAYWWAERPPASRFLYDSGLRATWAPEEWRAELVEDLRRTKPAYLAVGASGPQPWLVGTNAGAEEQIAEYPALRSLLEGSYRLVEDMHLFRVYERIGRAARVTP